MVEKQVDPKAQRHKQNTKFFNFYSSLRLGVLVANLPCNDAWIDAMGKLRNTVN